MEPFTPIDFDFLPDTIDGTYLVGGSVRDMLSKNIPGDIDLVVDGDIHLAAEHVAKRTGGTIVKLGKGDFSILRVASPVNNVDISPLLYTSVEENLWQRDFTINAMAYDLKKKELIDCTNGQRDLKGKRVRMVSHGVFTKDPVRLVRAYRMAATLHLTIEADTQSMIEKERRLVGTVPGERIWSELIKIFATPDSADIINKMAESGLLLSIFPELLPTIGCEQNHHHQYDVFGHTLHVYEHLEKILLDFNHHFPKILEDTEATALAGHAAILKYASLLHDIGKPATRIVDSNGLNCFPGHAVKSAEIAVTIGRRLRLSNHQRQIADAIIRHHLRPLFLFIADSKGTLGNRGMIRFFRHCGPLTLPIIIHAMADIHAKKETTTGRDKRFILFCERLINEYKKSLDRQDSVPSLVTGHDLISIFGLSPSPRFKRILNRVDEQRLCGELCTRDEALEWVERYIKHLKAK